MSVLYQFISIAVSVSGIVVLQYRWPHSTRPTIAQLILFAVYTALSLLHISTSVSILYIIIAVSVLYPYPVLVVGNGIGKYIPRGPRDFSRAGGQKPRRRGNLLLYVLHQSYFSTINVLKFFLVYECQHCSCLHHYWNIANVFRARMCSCILPRECTGKYCP